MMDTSRGGGSATASGSTSRQPDGTAVCDATATNRYGVTRLKYEGGDEGFQYYASTSNPHHLPPSSAGAIGRPDEANHQYDLADLWVAAENGHLPAVSFVKAACADQGGGRPSDPLDEQVFVVDFVNRLQQLPTWPETAVIILYDDSDGSYDHVLPPLVNSSQTGADALTGPGRCGGPTPRLAGYQGRCGHGPRLPFLVVSPWSRMNQVDHTMTDQTSVIRFIEDNWQLGRIGDGSFDALAGPLTGLFDFNRRHESPLILDPATGLPLAGPGHCPVAPQGRRSGPGTDLARCAPRRFDRPSRWRWETAPRILGSGRRRPRALMT